MVIVVLMMVVVMAVIMFMFVMRTALRRLAEPSFQAGGDQGFDWGTGLTGSHLDALLGKDAERAAANAADNHNFDPQAPQPTREGARLMIRRRESLGVECRLGALIHLDHCKVIAAAEV